MTAESRSYLKGQQFVIVSFCLTEQGLVNLPPGSPQPVICLDQTSCVLPSHTNSFHLLTHGNHRISPLLFHQASRLPLPTSAFFFPYIHRLSLAASWLLPPKLPSVCPRLCSCSSWSLPKSTWTLNGVHCGIKLIQLR